MKILEQPYNHEELKKLVNEDDGLVEGIVVTEIGDFIDNDLEGVLDMLSEKLIGDSLLTDIDYEVVGTIGDNILVRVNGFAEHIAEEYEEPAC